MSKSSNKPRTVAEYREWYLANKPEGVAFGECFCGCKTATTLASYTDRSRRCFKGEPRAYAAGHGGRSRLSNTATASAYREWYIATKPSNVAFGECFCGCGASTNVPNYTDSCGSIFKGEPRRYIPGHTEKTFRNGPKTRRDFQERYLANKPEGVAWGECWCGCQQPTPLSDKTSTHHRFFEGEPRRFITGHNGTVRAQPGPDYLEEDRGFDTPCWVWQRGLTFEGYARKNFEGQSRPVHAVHYEQTFGQIPTGHELHHRCEIRACVNPNHVQPLIRRDHVYASSWVKLSMEKAELIRHLYSTGNYTQVELAARFNVSQAVISSIVRYEIWL